MSIDQSELKLIYNEQTGKITMEAYDQGFFNYEIDMTNAVLELAVEKLFNDMGCEPNGGQITLTRKADKRGDVVKVLGKIKR